MKGGSARRGGRLFALSAVAARVRQREDQGCRIGALHYFTAGVLFCIRLLLPDSEITDFAFR